MARKSPTGRRSRLPDIQSLPGTVAHWLSKVFERGPSLISAQKAGEVDALLWRLDEIDEALADESGSAGPEWPAHRERLLRERADLLAKLRRDQ